jgi:hypothetical protein
MSRLEPGTKVVIVGSRGFLPLSLYLVGKMGEGVEVSTDQGPIYLKPMPVLEWEVKPATRIKVGKGPRDKWGKLK